MRKSLTVLPALLIAGTASAQDSDWSYRATLYGWVPALSTTVDTRFGTINEPSGSASDVLSALDMAFMGTFAAQKAELGFVADLLYADLSNSVETPFSLFGDATVGVKLGALSGYVLYRVSGASAATFDVGAGFRTFDVSVNVDLSAGVPPLGQPASSQGYDLKWTDPLLAARVTVPLDDKWFLNGFADFGGTGSDQQTYQVYGGVGYNFNRNWSTQLGYRYMNLTHPVSEGQVDIGLSGFLVAVSYTF